MKLINSHQLFELDLSPEIMHAAQNKNFLELDRLMSEFIASDITPILKTFKDFDHIEHLISLRSGTDPFEEDGIWHDDGSRVLAFSLSLNVFGNITGGSLGFRKKNTSESEYLLGPYPAGTLLVFQTGVDGYEHRTSRVLSGERLVCAGWCSYKIE
jgi:hypothetical protein